MVLGLLPGVTADCLIWMGFEDIEMEMGLRLVGFYAAFPTEIFLMVMRLGGYFIAEFERDSFSLSREPKARSLAVITRAGFGIKSTAVGALFGVTVELRFSLRRMVFVVFCSLRLPPKFNPIEGTYNFITSPSGLFSFDRFSSSFLPISYNLQFCLFKLLCPLSSDLSGLLLFSA